MNRLKSLFPRRKSFNGIQKSSAYYRKQRLRRRRMWWKETGLSRWTTLRFDIHTKTWYQSSLVVSSDGRLLFNGYPVYRDLLNVPKRVTIAYEKLRTKRLRAQAKWWLRTHRRYIRH